MFLEDSGVTSYRGVETIGCVGMQSIVEPDLGLCDNLKPNRFLGTERKRFFKDLAIARSFIFQGWFLMNLLQQSALAWKEIIDRILQNKIPFEMIQKASQYDEMIKPRLEAITHLKSSLDNDFTLYSYMPRMYPFVTNIKADYLIASHTNIESFIFIIRSTPQNKSQCDFLCCSIFKESTRDYETNQRTRVLLKKERIHIPSNTSVILLDKLNAQK